VGKRIYTVPWTGTVANAGGNADLWEVLPADDLPCKIRGVRLGQTSEVGDAAEEILSISVVRLRATVTSGSGGSAGAPEQVDLANQAPGFAVEVNNTTVATTDGDTEILEYLAWNERASPFEVWYPDPDFAPRAVQGEALLIRLNSTVADDITFAGTLWVEEG
jgi:hypothetical protein